MTKRDFLIKLFVVPISVNYFPQTKPTVSFDTSVGRDYVPLLLQKGSLPKEMISKHPVSLLCALNK